MNYSRNLITGTLCSPLCDTSQIKVDKCMRRGTKLHVLKAKWNEEEIVLKIPKALENHTTSWQLERLSSRFINFGEDFKMTKEDMIKYVSSL